MKRKSVPFLKIGIFVLSGFIILIVFIFYLGSNKKLFSSTASLRARFQTVSNLRPGAEVDMVGINVGSVESIQLPRNSRDSVTVTFKVLTDALKLIHTDSKAIITTQGLIGDKLINVTMGSDSTPAVPPGTTLQGQAPQDFTKIYDTLSAVVAQLDSVATSATQLVSKISNGNGTLGKLVNNSDLYDNANAMLASARVVMDTAQLAVRSVSNSFQRLSSSVNDITDKIKNGEGSLGKLLTRDDIYNNAKTASDKIAQSSYALNDALAKLALGSGRFAEIMEGLKHNWLVKSYFEDRGYWDAPAFELTIDRKIDSLNHLEQMIESRSQVK